jgi:hypothetical protein
MLMLFSILPRIPGVAMARSVVTAALLLLPLGVAPACGGSPPAPAAAQKPEPSAAAVSSASASPAPSPTSVTKANPGGDAADPEKAALERLANEPWGFRRDKWNTLHVPLVDWKNWRRVRIWGHPTRATYRYGDNHKAIDTILYTAITGPSTPEACLAKFNEDAIATAQSYGVRMSEPQLIRMTQLIGDDAKPLLVQLREGSIDTILANDDYVGAVAVYQSWPGTCLVRGFAVVATRHRELAIKIRDRWVREGAPGLVWEKQVKEAPATESR